MPAFAGPSGELRGVARREGGETGECQGLEAEWKNCFRRNSKEGAIGSTFWLCHCCKFSGLGFQVKADVSSAVPYNKMAQFSCNSYDVEKPGTS